MGERGSAGSDDLDERVGVLDLVGVLLGGAVNTLHALTLGSTSNTSLGSVDVVVETVESTDSDHGGNALEHNLHVVELVNLAGAHRVVAEEAHGPAERTTLLEELCVQLGLAFSLELLIGRSLTNLGGGQRLLVGNGGLLALLERLVARVGGLGRLVVAGKLIVLLVLLDDGVVGNLGLLSVGGSGALEQKGALNEVVPLDGVVLLDNLGVDEGDEEESGHDSETTASSHGDGGNVPRGLLVQAQVGRSLVDDGKRADGTGDEKEEGRGVDSPRDRVLADVNNELNEHEDDGTEASRDGGSHAQTSEDGTETLSVVPSPLDLVGTSGSNTHTSNGGNQRVSGGDVGGVSRAPHDPGRGSGEGAGEGEHLDTGIVVEGGVGDDAVLDGLGSTGTDGDGSKHLEDGAEDHGLSVGNGSRRHTGRPSVCNIV